MKFQQDFFSNLRIDKLIFIFLQVNGTKIFKSGSDFRCFSEIVVSFGDNGSYLIDSQMHLITKDIAEDPDIKKIVDKYLGELMHQHRLVAFCLCFTSTFLQAFLRNQNREREREINCTICCIPTNYFSDIVEEKMEGVLGHIEVELDGRFTSIRHRETNLGLSVF